MNPYEIEFTRTATKEAELQYSRHQLREVWGVLHRLIAATVYSKEADHPALFEKYRDICEQYGETAIEAEVK